MDVRVGLWRKLSAEELMLLKCGVGEDTWVPWTARRSNQSILKEISPGISLEEMMLKLKRQYFGHLMQRVDSLEKTLMLGGIGGRRRSGWQDKMAGWHHWLDGRKSEWTLGVGDGQGGLVCCDSWGCKESDTPERLNWTELCFAHCMSANVAATPGITLIQGDFITRESENRNAKYFKSSDSESSDSDI